MTKQEKDQLSIIERLLDRRNHWDYGKPDEVPAWCEEFTVPGWEELSSETIEMAKSYGLHIVEARRRETSITYSVKQTPHRRR